MHMSQDVVNPRLKAYPAGNPGTHVLRNAPIALLPKHRHGRISNFNFQF